MTVFNNNIQNTRGIEADNIYISAAEKGQALVVGDNGLLIPKVEQSISTLSFLNGVTEQELEQGHAWLVANDKDETLTLQSLLSDDNDELTKMGISEGALRTFVIESPTGFLFIDGSISIPNNTSLQFKCYVACSRTTRFQSTGSMDESPPNISDAPIITSNVSIGDTVIYVKNNGYNMSSWTANDHIAIRSISKKKREDNRIQSIALTSPSNYAITLQNEMDDFSISANDGTVRRYNAFSLLTNVSRGSCSLNIDGDFTKLDIGTYISIIDQRKSGDIFGSASNIVNDSGKPWWYSNNDFRREQRMIVRVDSVNKIIELESPISNDYDTVNAFILIMKPRENCKISGLRWFYIQEPVYPRPNNHMILFDTAVNCVAEDLTFSDSFTEFSSNIVQYPNIDNLVRLRDSYACHIKDVNILRANNTFSDSGASYGITTYYSSYCTFQNLFASSLRHNLLIQGGDHCQFNNMTFKNVLISGFDAHGLNARDMNVTNLYVDISKGQSALLSNNASQANSSIGMCRLGNSTHGTGDSFFTFNGVVLKNGMTGSNITSVYGIELVPNSSGNVFNNVHVEDCDTAINLMDHPRGRLNSNLISASNVFNNFTIKNCKEILNIDSANSTSNSSHYLSTTCSNASTNRLVINSTNSITGFNNVFNGWILQHNTSNYAVSNYTASNKQVTLTTNLNPLPSNGSAIVLKDSLIQSVRQVKDVTLTNCVILNCSNQCVIDWGDHVRLVNNYIVNSGESNTRYTFDVKNTNDCSIINNVTEDCMRFIQASNTSNLRVVGNQIITQRETNILNDNGSNVSVLWKHNNATGFNETLTTDATTTYLYDNTTLGYNATPNRSVININNSNGFIGIGTSNPSTNFHLLAGNASCALIQSTSTNFCALSLQDSNTSSLSNVQIRSSNNIMILRGSNSDTLFLSGGRVGVGKQRTSGRMHIFESSGSIPFFNFDNNNVIANDSNINTQNHGAYYGRVMVRIEGVGNKWLALYD